MLILTLSTALAYELNKNSAGAQIHWEDPTILYLINPIGLTDRYSQEEIAETVERAGDAWEAALDQQITFEFDGFEQSTRLSDYEDGYSVIYFVNGAWTFPVEEGERGVGYASTYTEETTGIGLGFDMALNPLADLTVTDNPEEVMIDLQSVVAHEFGHVLGLGHSAIETATMYRAIDDGEMGWRTLDQDDVAGIKALYPPGSIEEADTSSRMSCGGGKTSLAFLLVTPILFLRMRRHHD